MIKINVDKELNNICPDLKLGVIQCNVVTTEECLELWGEIDQCIQIKESILTPEIIRNLKSIISSKNAYRTLGKDPNRYRLSAESLLRRIANKKSLYQINNVVDLLNLVSIESGFSIGDYNVSKIQGEINFGIGKEAENYEGIGRGDLNIVNLPVFRDELGAFGSPTSDSVRTSITTDCKIFLMIIISFQKEEGLQKAINHAVNLLTQYANATQIETQII